MGHGDCKPSYYPASDLRLTGLSSEQGMQTGEFRAHDRAILWTTHHPKEQQLITASSDGTVKIWGMR